MGAIGVLIAAFMVLASAIHSFWLLCLGLLIFFTAFNVLEASIPAWISKIAPSQMRGTALSVHSIFQFLGPAVGGYASGFLYDHYGAMAVYGFCAALAVIWGWVALSLRPITPPRAEDNVFQALEGR